MRLQIYYVYILTNAHHTVLYTGVTNDLERRCREHIQKKQEGFTKRYNVNKLVYYEKFDQIDIAIVREKQIKGYIRAKKLSMINLFNSKWINLHQNGRIILP